MEEPLKELKNQINLIKQEREAEYEYFKAMVQSLPMEQRIVKGYCWYPLQVLKSGYTIGDRAFVLVERTRNRDHPHHFRAGKMVNLITQQARIHDPEQSGVIDYIDQNKMKIILNTKDLPNWIRYDMLGVEMLFDARTYQEMDKAIHQVLDARDNRLAELRSIFLGIKAPQSVHLASNVAIEELNTAQNEAVKDILMSSDVAVVHGPPGTGKTTTLIYAIRELCKVEKTVLVTAPSNTATDLLTERLAKLDLNVVRIGNISRVDEGVIVHTLEVKLSDHPESKNIKKVRLQAAEMRKQAWRIRRSYGRREREERMELLKEASELSGWAKQLEDRLVEQILSSAQVITCTLVGANHPLLDGYKFQTVVIDEAAQALEPATWIPIIKASKVVLAGDPFQLPPTVKSMEAKKGGFEITLIEKALHRFDAVSFLNVQYRMNEKIMQFSNQQFYRGELRAHESVKSHLLPIESNMPVEFIDTAGCGFDERINEQFQSRYNPDEFQILCEHLYQLVEAIKPVEPPISIALISPYREQVIYMQACVEDDRALQGLDITINTIDGFQGQERDVVYISLVRSNRKSEIGFLTDYRRMNVAMTRAKKKLIIVGDSSTIGNNPFYANFLAYCESLGSYRTAWEFMIPS